MWKKQTTQQKKMGKRQKHFVFRSKKKKKAS